MSKRDTFFGDHYTHHNLGAIRSMVSRMAILTQLSTITLEVTGGDIL